MAGGFGLQTSTFRLSIAMHPHTRQSGNTSSVDSEKAASTVSVGKSPTSGMPKLRVAQPLHAVAAVEYATDPFLVGQIPVDGAGHAGFE